MRNNREEVARLNPQELIATTDKLAQDTHEITAALLVYLGEIDVRGLHRELGYASLFAYTTGRLGFSESAAYKRIQAARAARKFPQLVYMVAEGRLHLSGICTLVGCLTEDNADALLQEACGKSKRDIEQLVVRVAPKPVVPTVIRARPSAAPAPAPASAPVPVPAPASAPVSAPASSSTAASSIACVNASSGVVLSAADKEVADHNIAPRVPNTVAPSLRTRPGASIAPQSSTTYTLRMTLDATTRAKLDELTALISRQVPNGDAALVIAHAIDVALQVAQKQRGLATPRKQAEPTLSASRVSLVQPHPQSHPQSQSQSQPEPEHQSSMPNQLLGMAAQVQNGVSDGTTLAVCTVRVGFEPRTRAIPRAVKREVVVRDQGQCTFVGSDNHRCGERWFLEFHHKHPFAKGGAHVIDNIILLCHAHNMLEAERDFGRDKMNRYRSMSASRELSLTG